MKCSREFRKLKPFNFIYMFIPQDRKNYDAIMGDGYTWRDGCPFCDSLSQDQHTLWKGKYWYILYNLFPYSGDDQHLMAVPYVHKAFSHELDQDEISELSDIYAFMKNFYGDRQYFSCTRESMANRSIEHFHMHFIPGKLQGSHLRKMLELQGFPIIEDLQIQ